MMVAAASVGLLLATGIEIIIAIALVAQTALSLADSLGAFGSNLPGTSFPEIDNANAANAADVELQAAQRRADQRRSILAGGEFGQEISVGFATVLGPQDAQAPDRQTTFLGG